MVLFPEGGLTRETERLDTGVVGTGLVAVSVGWVVLASDTAPVALDGTSPSPRITS